MGGLFASCGAAQPLFIWYKSSRFEVHWIVMALEMRSVCERCDAPLKQDGEAVICSYECTFCPACSKEMKNICPNCGGELIRRPKRKTGG